MAAHNTTGKQGEALALEFFEKKGYVILEKNWRHRQWEIDLIASNQNILHFIEVKTCTTLNFGHPEEKVDRNKLRFIINASVPYLYLNPRWKRVQFDVLSITMLKGKEAEYFLIEDVYL